MDFSWIFILISNHQKYVLYLYMQPLAFSHRVHEFFVQIWFATTSNIVKFLPSLFKNKLAERKTILPPIIHTVRWCKYTRPTTIYISSYFFFFKSFVVGFPRYVLSYIPMIATTNLFNANIDVLDDIRTYSLGPPHAMPKSKTLLLLYILKNHSNSPYQWHRVLL